jgi:hypothetical protein
MSRQVGAEAVAIDIGEDVTPMSGFAAPPIK